MESINSSFANGGIVLKSSELIGERSYETYISINSRLLTKKSEVKKWDILTYGLVKKGKR